MCLSKGTANHRLTEMQDQPTESPPHKAKAVYTCVCWSKGRARPNQPAQDVTSAPRTTQKASQAHQPPAPLELAASDAQCRQRTGAPSQPHATLLPAVLPHSPTRKATTPPQDWAASLEPCSRTHQTLKRLTHKANSHLLAQTTTGPVRQGQQLCHNPHATPGHLRSGKTGCYP